MTSVPLLLSFLFAPVDTQLPQTIILGGFNVTSLAAVPAPMIKMAGTADIGYQFPNAGMEVSLPAAVNVVELRACTFASPIHVEAQNSVGQALGTAQQVSDNRCVDLQFSARGISKIRLTNGNNEGMLVTLRIEINAQ
jgi:hypothetical protein